MFLLPLDTIDKWKAAFERGLVSPVQIADAVTEGVLTEELRAEAHPATTGQNYSGKASVRKVYLFEGVQVSPDGEGWFTIDMKPATVWKVAMLVAQEEPRIATKLYELNGNVMPNIRPPVEPVTPEPDEQPQTEETP
jgi:hypothetical protein